MSRSGQPRLSAGLLCLVLLLAVVLGILPAMSVRAATSLVQESNNNALGTQAKFAAAPQAGNLLIVVCSANGTATITAPSGFTTAITQSGAIAQAIYYKVATGNNETTLGCGFTSSSTAFVELLEYGNLPGQISIDKTASSSAKGQGNNTTMSTGSLVTGYNNELLIGAIASNAKTKVPTGWTNAFIKDGSIVNQTTQQQNRGTLEVAHLDAATMGSYSSSSSVAEAADWNGQIVAFRLSVANPMLMSDIVDANGNAVNAPGVNFTSLTQYFACQTATGSLGTSSQRIRLRNSTGNPSWTLALAATDGPTAKWQAGTSTYAYNNPSGGGCTGGQLAIDPASATVTPQTGCSATNLTKGQAAAFNAGTVNSVTLATGSGTPYLDCYYDLTDVNLSQKVPANQPGGNYTLNLTLTVTAN